MAWLRRMAYGGAPRKKNGVVESNRESLTDASIPSNMWKLVKARACTTAIGNNTELLHGSTKATWVKGVMVSSAARGVRPGRHNLCCAAAWPEELGFGATLGDPARTSSGTVASCQSTCEVAQLGEEVDGVAQRRGGLVKAKPVARGVVVARHAEAETGDWVWREEVGHVDLRIMA
jgi:hypothetical protein